MVSSNLAPRELDFEARRFFFFLSEPRVGAVTIEPCEPPFCPEIEHQMAVCPVGCVFTVSTPEYPKQGLFCVGVLHMDATCTRVGTVCVPVQGVGCLRSPRCPRA